MKFGIVDIEFEIELKSKSIRKWHWWWLFCCDDDNFGHGVGSSGFGGCYVGISVVGLVLVLLFGYDG